MAPEPSRARKQVFANNLPERRDREYGVGFFSSEPNQPSALARHESNKCFMLGNSSRTDLIARSGKLIYTRGLGKLIDIK